MTVLCTLKSGSMAGMKTPKLKTMPIIGINTNMVATTITQLVCLLALALTLSKRQLSMLPYLHFLCPELLLPDFETSFLEDEPLEFSKDVCSETHDVAILSADVEHEMSGDVWGLVQ